MNNFIDSKYYKLIYFILSLLCIFYGKNIFLNYITHIYILILIITLPFMISTSIYLFVCIWVLIIYQNEYQIFILTIEIILMIKGIISIISDNNYKFKIKNILFINSIFSYIIISFILYNDISALRLISTILIIIIFTEKAKKNRDNFSINNYMYLYVLSVCSAIIYGIINNNYMIVRYGSEIMRRFNGIHAPNYMALYINLGILMCMFSDLFTKKLNILIIVFMWLGLLLTKSMSGLIIGLIILVIYIIKQLKKYKKNQVILRILFLIFILIIFAVNYKSILKLGSIKRILKKDSYSLNNLTNSRSEIWKIYLNRFLELNIVKKIFGTAIFSLTKPNKYISNQMFGAHNTYLELLWALGVIGLFVFISYSYLCTKKMEYSKDYITIKIIKIVLYIYMLSISLITNRIFYLLFFL